jgi:hypothetical protein
MSLFPSLCSKPVSDGVVQARCMPKHFHDESMTSTLCAVHLHTLTAKAGIYLRLVPGCADDGPRSECPCGCCWALQFFLALLPGGAWRLQ